MHIKNITPGRPNGIYTHMNMREELLQAALKLFSEEGYDNVGVQKIADSCSVSKPALYYYFDSKNGILKEFVSVYMEPFISRLAAASVYKQDLTLSLEAVAKVYFTFAAEAGALYRLYLSFAYAPGGSETFRAIHPSVKQQFRIIERIFTQAEKHHDNLRGRSKLYTFTFIGMVNSYITTSYHGKAALSEKSAFLACRQFMHGILP